MILQAIEDGCVLLHGLMCVFTDCECLHSEALLYMNERKCFNLLSEKQKTLSNQLQE